MLFEDDRAEDFVIKSTVGKNKKRDEELNLKSDLE